MQSIDSLRELNSKLLAEIAELRKENADPAYQFNPYHGTVVINRLTWIFFHLNGVPGINRIAPNEFGS